MAGATAGRDRRSEECEEQDPPSGRSTVRVARRAVEPEGSHDPEAGVHAHDTSELGAPFAEADVAVPFADVAADVEPRALNEVLECAVSCEIDGDDREHGREACERPSELAHRRSERRTAHTAAPEQGVGGEEREYDGSALLCLTGKAGEDAGRPAQPGFAEFAAFVQARTPSASHSSMKYSVLA